MNTLRGILTLGLAFCLAIATIRADDDQSASQDQALLQGTWTMVSGTRDGVSLSPHQLSGSKRVAAGDETTITLDGELVMKAKFKLDPSKSPKTIDYDITGGAHEGAKQLGIYEISGETVKFCFAIPGNERPTEFASKRGDKLNFSVWKKQKP